MRIRDVVSFRHELVEQLIKVGSIKDHAGSLPHRLEARPPDLVKRAALDARVVHGLGVGQAALHV